MHKSLGFVGAIFFVALIIFDIYRGYVPFKSGNSPSIIENPIEFWIAIIFKAIFVCAFFYLGVNKKDDD